VKIASLCQVCQFRLLNYIAYRHVYQEVNIREDRRLCKAVHFDNVYLAGHLRDNRDN